MQSAPHTPGLSETMMDDPRSVLRPDQMARLEGSLPSVAGGGGVDTFNSAS